MKERAKLLIEFQRFSLSAFPHFPKTRLWHVPCFEKYYEFTRS